MTQGRDALDSKKTIYEEIAEGCDTVVCGANTIDMRLFVASVSIPSLFYFVNFSFTITVCIQWKRSK